MKVIVAVESINHQQSGVVYSLSLSLSYLLVATYNLYIIIGAIIIFFLFIIITIVYIIIIIIILLILIIRSIHTTPLALLLFFAFFMQIRFLHYKSNDFQHTTITKTRHKNEKNTFSTQYQT